MCIISSAYRHTLTLISVPSPFFSKVIKLFIYTVKDLKRGKSTLCRKRDIILHLANFSRENRQWIYQNVDFLHLIFFNWVFHSTFHWFDNTILNTKFYHLAKPILFATIKWLLVWTLKTNRILQISSIFCADVENNSRMKCFQLRSKIAKGMNIEQMLGVGTIFFLSQMP